MALSEFEVDSLKPFQVEALSSICSGRDTVVRVPTGLGKSIIFWVSFHFSSPSLSEAFTIIS